MLGWADAKDCIRLLLDSSPANSVAGRTNCLFMETCEEGGGHNDVINKSTEELSGALLCSQFKLTTRTKNLVEFDYKLKYRKGWIVWDFSSCENFLQCMG